jgi:DNA-binding MarR family transcriptional regulator
MCTTTDIPTSTLGHEIKKRQPFQCPGEEAYLNIVRTYSAVTAPAWRLFKQFNTTPAKYNILRILRGARATGESGPHGLPSLEIADRLITRVPDITRLVDGLIEDGLVERTRCTEDRRVVYVGITPEGLLLLEKLDAPVIALHNQAFADMTPDELSELNRLLVKARARVQLLEGIDSADGDR